ncbi:hypothetical protein [Pseudomonas brassicacearum]
MSLTTSPCWRRVEQLEEVGVITGYHAKIDNRKVDTPSKPLYC